MKTKIVYISGNEVFDMADIRAAFEEVRSALNLDKETVLFGVPVDADDAGLSAQEPELTAQINTVITEPEPEIEEIPEPIVSPIQDEIIVEPVIEELPKKRVRKTKVKDIEPESTAEQKKTTEQEEKIVPIMSILSVKSEEETLAEPKAEIITQEIKIVQEISDEKPDEEIPQETIEDIDEQEITDDEETDEEADLEKLLSAMTPLQEDILQPKEKPEPKAEPEYNDDISVDATLEQLATEFAETQDKIATANKSSSRSKIGKLRNILPFKQSKHKDQGLGDLFGWAGVAANDEDFSVPGFFTNAAAKK